VLVARRPAPAPGTEAEVAAVLRAAAPLAANVGLQILSPRVEFLVLSALAGDRATGVFLAALRVFEFLGMVPSAVAQGAMPALTREALRGGEGWGGGRRPSWRWSRPAAVGLALVAGGVVNLLYGQPYAEAATPLRLLAAALLPLFMNALLSWAVLARGRASWLPRLTAVRVAAAVAFALSLVPPLGAVGGPRAVVAEWLLLGAAWLACRRASFAVPLGGPLAAGLLACVPMALVVSGCGEPAPAVATGAYLGDRGGVEAPPGPGARAGRRAWAPLSVLLGGAW
jgi:O-antigen/teichoic acid export membrane protein